jgi:hypothetical protein
MIGIVGPEDAATSLVEVASEIGHERLVVQRQYQSVTDAVAVARQLDPVCEVILFAGRVPHRLATDAGGFRAKLQYVPDGAIDLYRAIALVALERDQSLERISIDTASTDVVDEVFGDLGLTTPRHLLPLEEIAGDWSTISEQMVEFHRSRFRAGEVTLCMTWLGQVVHELARDGVPARRITHTRAAHRQALLRAELTMSASRSAASQVAAALVRPAPPSAEAAVMSAEGAQELLRRFAERLQGHLSTDEQLGAFVVYTTRGVLESEISRLQAGLAEPLAPDQDHGWTVGFGVGSSAREAATLAGQAAQAGSRGQATCVMYADGTARSVDQTGQRTPVQLRTVEDNDAHAGLPLRPYALKRLIDAIRQIDPAGFTAKQLGGAYGVQERSARRILGSLEEAGLAVRVGLETSPGAGRPKTLYNVDFERLIGEHTA